MYGSGYIFSKQFFTGWVVVGIIWIFCSLFAVGLFPIYQGRHTLVGTVRFIFSDLTGKKGIKTIHAENQPVVATPGDVTPPEKKEAARETTITQ
jgi:urea-proton symporter